MKCITAYPAPVFSLHFISSTQFCFRKVALEMFLTELIINNGQIYLVHYLLVTGVYKGNRGLVNELILIHVLLLRMYTRLTQERVI